MKIISGNSNRELSEKISSYLQLDLTKATIKRFSDGEIWVEINENIRGEDVYVIQSTSYPANDNLMELLVTIDACKRSSARRITAVIPYYGYARQDRKPAPRSPISAKLVANMITTAGAERVLTLDLQAGQIQGFFDIPVDNLYASPVFCRDIREHFDISKITIVSPDTGGVVRARHIAQRIGDDVGLAIIDKRREHANTSQVMHVIGNVENTTCLIVDDIVDTAGTLCQAATALLENGALDVHAYISHGVLSGPALSRIEGSELRSLVVTDSIAAAGSPKIRRVGISELIGEGILRTNRETSVSSLFH